MTDFSPAYTAALNVAQGFAGRVTPQDRADFVTALTDLHTAVKGELDAVIEAEAAKRVPVVGGLVGKIMADAANKALDDLINEATAAKTANAAVA